MQIKYVTAIFLLLTAPAYAQTGTAKTITQLNTEINSQFPDQNVGAITPFIFRQLNLDLVASTIIGLPTPAQIGTGSASHAVPVDVSGAIAWKVVPNCTDTIGQHLNYTQSTDVFSCGTSFTGGALAFYFDKNGSNQTGMTTSAYTQITWSTTKFNTTGAALASNRWTAPIDGIVHMDISAYWNTKVDPIGNVTAVKIIKNSAGTCNGADVFAGVGTAVYNAPGLGIVQASGYDQTTAGDVYEVCAYSISVTPANDLGLDGNQAHTHWSGAYIR